MLLGISFIDEVVEKIIMKINSFIYSRYNRMFSIWCVHVPFTQLFNRVLVHQYQYTICEENMSVIAARKLSTTTLELFIS